MIPFKRIFKPEEQDKHLLEKLFLEAPGIFNWALEGCLLWQNEGLNSVTAREIVKATEDYRLDMNTLQAFINDCCVLGGDKSISAKELYETYVNWCRETGEKAESKIIFGKRLKTSKNNLESKRTGHNNVDSWLGIGVPQLL